MKNMDDQLLTDILAHSPIFHGIAPEKIRRKFLPAMHLVHFQKQMKRRGFLTNQYFYLVARGVVHGFLMNENGERKVTLFVLRKGDGFDVITLLDEQNSMVSYDCLGMDVTCLAVPLAEMKNWGRQEPEIAKALLLYMGRLLLELEELVFDLSLNDTATRLIKLLLKHADTTIEKDHGVPVLHHLTHEELASLIGSVRVVVNRQLKKLKEMSLIEMEKGKVIVNDLKALMEMMEKHTREMRK